EPFTSTDSLCDADRHRPCQGPYLRRRARVDGREPHAGHRVGDQLDEVRVPRRGVQRDGTGGGRVEDHGRLVTAVDDLDLPARPGVADPHRRGGAGGDPDRGEDAAVYLDRHARVVLDVRGRVGVPPGRERGCDPEQPVVVLDERFAQRGRDHALLLGVRVHTGEGGQTRGPPLVLPGQRDKGRRDLATEPEPGRLDRVVAPVLQRPVRPVVVRPRGEPGQ